MAYICSCGCVTLYCYEYETWSFPWQNNDVDRQESLIRECIRKVWLHYTDKPNIASPSYNPTLFYHQLTILVTIPCTVSHIEYVRWEQDIHWMLFKAVMFSNEAHQVLLYLPICWLKSIGQRLFAKNHPHEEINALDGGLCGMPRVIINTFDINNKKWKTYMCISELINIDN